MSGFYAKKKHERTLIATRIVELIAQGKQSGFTTVLLDDITLLVFSMI